MKVDGPKTPDLSQFLPENCPTVGSYLGSFQIDFLCFQ